MNTERLIEILTFFAYGDSYSGHKLQDKDFTKAELIELKDADYITCIELSPLRYLITIKGSRRLKEMRVN